MKIEVFDRFNPPPGPGVDCRGDEPLTMQEFKEETDVNRIMARATSGAQFPENVKVGEYGDFADAPTFQEAQNLILYAQTQFNALPAKLRDRFGNDPVAFARWIHDPKTTLEEANELGLLKEEASKRLEAERAAAAAAALSSAAPAAAPAPTVTVETLKT